MELTEGGCLHYLVSVPPPGFPPPIFLVVVVHPAESVAIDGDAVSTEAPQWVVFACAGRRFGVPMASVREILPARPATRLPGCGPEALGLVGRRGRVVTTFDFGAVMALRPAAANPGHRLLLIEHDDKLLGFAVDDVIAVVRAAEPETRPSAGEAGLPGGPEDAMLGAIGAGDDGFLAIDPRPILTRLLR